MSLEDEPEVFRFSDEQMDELLAILDAPSLEQSEISELLGRVVAAAEAKGDGWVLERESGDE